MNKENKEMLELLLLGSGIVLFIGLTGWAFFSSIFGAFHDNCVGINCPISMGSYFFLPFVMVIMIVMVAFSDKPKRKKK